MQYQITASDALNLKANLYHTKNEFEKDVWGEGAGFKTVGFNLGNTWKLDQHTLEVGTNLRRDKGYYINQPASSTTTGEEVAKVAGIYVQDHWQVNQQLNVTAGLRWDSYKLTDNIDQKHSDSGAAPNLGMQYKIDDNWQLRAGYAEAFRGPKIKEAFVLEGRRNAPNLKGERAKNFELGVDYDQGNFSASVTAFNSTIDDVVERIDGVMNNGGKLKTKGVTANLAYAWDNSEVSAGYSYVRPELDGQPLNDGNMSLGTALGDTLTLSFEQQIPDFNLALGWSGRLVKRLTDVGAGRAEKAGYGVHDVYARWLPTANEDLSVTLTVKNLFDKQYRDHGTFGVSTSSGNTLGLAEPGRDVRLTLSSRF